MAHVLTIYLGTATPITLDVDGSYVPSSGSGDTIREQIPIVVSSTTTALLQTAFQAIESITQAAARRATTGRGDRAYLAFTPDGYSASAYRSEIIRGWLQPQGRAFAYDWTAKRLRALLVIDRVNFWEGPETELALSVTAAPNSYATGGVTIYNHADAGAAHGNWVQIAATSVLGTLPAPAIVKVVQYPATLSPATQALYIGHGAAVDPSLYTHNLEGENSFPTQGTTEASDLCAYGYYERCAVPATDAIVTWWNIAPSADGNIFGGGLFAVLARFHTAPTGITIHLETKLATNGTVVTVETTAPITLDAKIIQHIGSVHLPPNGPSASAYPYCEPLLYLYGHKAGTANIDIDFLHLFPADSFRTLRAVLADGAVHQGDQLIDDAVQDRTYVLSSYGESAHVAGAGNRVMLLPGKKQRLYFLARMDDNSADIARPYVITLCHRPRRRTL